jgi:hypothetical protein
VEFIPLSVLLLLIVARKYFLCDAEVLADLLKSVIHRFLDFLKLSQCLLELLRYVIIL